MATGLIAPAQNSAAIPRSSIRIECSSPLWNDVCFNLASLYCGQQWLCMPLEAGESP
jgi:hypothetical protein